MKWWFMMTALIFVAVKIEHDIAVRERVMLKQAKSLLQDGKTFNCPNNIKVNKKDGWAVVGIYFKELDTGFRIYVRNCQVEEG